MNTNAIVSELRREAEENRRRCFERFNSLTPGTAEWATQLCLKKYYEAYPDDPVEAERQMCRGAAGL